MTQEISLHSENLPNYFYKHIACLAHPVQDNKKNLQFRFVILQCRHVRNNAIRPHYNMRKLYLTIGTTLPNLEYSDATLQAISESLATAFDDTIKTIHSDSLKNRFKADSFLITNCCDYAIGAKKKDQIVANTPEEAYQLTLEQEPDLPATYLRNNYDIINNELRWAKRCGSDIFCYHHVKA